MSIDTAHHTFTSLTAEIDANISNILTEEDAKINIILRILAEVLDWHPSDISSERKHDTGHSDFIVSSTGTKAFLLEAKRLWALSLATQETSKLRHFKLSGTSLKDVQPGINQAANYAVPSGLFIAVLTDGATWIVFKTFTPGSHFKDHDAFVFPSLQAISNDFTVFYELLSKEAFSKKLYNLHFDKLHHNRLLLSQVLKAPVSNNEIKIRPKSDIAFDLDQVFTAFFSRLAGEKDDELLVECFVETRESRIADFALEKITTNVLGNISSPDKDVDSELRALIQNAVEFENGQTVFIVGPTGAGKTTFLERFFKKTLSRTLFRQCVVLQVNCLDSSGREDTALHWLTETLIQSLEQQLYTTGAPSWDELRGLYYSDYVRRREGVDAPLYRDDPEKFKQKFSDYLDKKVEEDREGYLRRIMNDVVANRKRLPIIIIDNTDEFSADYKKEIFQFCQSLRREVNHCILLFPVTDKSAWSFSKTDLYSIYKSKSFFLPTPAPREVFRKRIEFIRAKIDSLASENERREYIAQKGIRISIESLEGFASIVESVFVEHEHTSRTIGELSNYNIRRTLELSQRVITSSVYQIEDLLKAVVSGRMAEISYSKFMNALLKGDYNLYKQNDNHFVVPIFQVDDHVRQSPLLALRILTLLRATKYASRTVEDKHLTVQSLFGYFDAMGCPEGALDCALLRLLDSGLIEPFDPSVRDLSPNQRLAIAFAGMRHLELALYNEIVFEQMAITTAIVNPDVAGIIRSAYLGNSNVVDKMCDIRHTFAEFLLKEDSNHLYVPEEGEQYECQRELSHCIESFGPSGSRRGVETHEEPAEESVSEGVIATVDWYDPDKGYGFVDVENEEFQAFLHSEILKEGKVDRVFDGDRLLCDVARNEKGFFVNKVHDFKQGESKSETVAAEVVRVFWDRRYGFVQLSDGRRDAFFHFSSLESDTIRDLTPGKKLEVEISPDKSGKGFVVRREVAHL